MIQCKDCRFYNPETATTGRCRYDPPHPFTFAQQNGIVQQGGQKNVNILCRGIWPEVLSDEGCGRGQPKA